MYMTGTSLLAPRNTLINVHRVNQSLARQSGASNGEDRRLNRDTVNISPQGKAASLIENLTKQKMAITERKDQFLASAVEEGQSMEAIQSQLDSYDEQIKNIDKQIAEITAKKMQEDAKKKQPKVQDNQPKTEEDIQNQKLANITELSMSLDKINTIDSIKTQVDGDIGVLESEIELDKMRANGMPGSLEQIEKKEALLSDMKAQSLDLTSDIGQELSEASKIIDKNNDLASMQPVEENNTSTSAEENNGSVLAKENNVPTPADVTSTAKGNNKSGSEQELSNKAE